ncbi:MAG TPA: hypothetical protein VEC57_10805 [Candidatus Limnocylindrales bacterium]|nr:hypothetical protein [Candidatus Limnocylindrales bacterium]
MNEMPDRKPGAEDDGVRIVANQRRHVSPIEILAGIAILAGVVLIVAPLASGLWQTSPESAAAEVAQVDDEDGASPRRRKAPPPPAAASSAPAPAAGPSAAAQARRKVIVPHTGLEHHENRDVSGRDEGKPGRAQNKKDQPEIDAKDYIEALRAAGETEGIAAFPPPGTDPPKSGLIVPEDYELPEGYVRHYQTTDDGEQLAAILMFSPDYEFYDQNGNPLPVPDDRIVPPEMAPPDLPLRTLDVPERKRR